MSTRSKKRWQIKLLFAYTRDNTEIILMKTSTIMKIEYEMIAHTNIEYNWKEREHQCRLLSDVSFMTSLRFMFVVEHPFLYRLD